VLPQAEKAMEKLKYSWHQWKYQVIVFPVLWVLTSTVTHLQWRVAVSSSSGCCQKVWTTWEAPGGFGHIRDQWDVLGQIWYRFSYQTDNIYSHQARLATPWLAQLAPNFRSTTSP
jgi:hypothetical protein